ncbi:MAG TPA: fibrillarin-like rRNA/tRNA 2'-O-methyltransferase [Candidatus Deferrimicrobium sp.]|nr:fibrillarin-like rRNA/tRNA 2'-O-methyltransferase [Candidatus Deferrimicrobium sp.]
MTKELSAHKSLVNTFWYKKLNESETLLTLNYTPGHKAYDEKLLEIDGKEYRVWNPNRSKIAAAIIKHLQTIPITRDSHILYLGAASGTTCSHLSDIVRDQGKIYCIEFSSRVIRELVQICEIRTNLIPILGDVRYPYQYRMLIPEQIDIIYADVAQPEQAQIIISNAEMFLKSNGWILLFVKSRSVDVTMDPQRVYKEQIEILKKANFKIVEVIVLDPFSEDHALIVAQWLK